MKSKILIASAAFTLGGQIAYSQNGNKPNFVIILLDDMGFADLSCYGGPIPTPNIDRLAKGGVRMSQMYNCARSCPTRASLLTGLYPQQAGVGHMVYDRSKEAGSNSYQGYLNNSCVTLAEVMSENGYYTAMAGKWHVGHHKGVTPISRGFEHALHSANGGFYFYNDPKAIMYIDDKQVKSNDSRLPAQWYSTDLLTTYAMKYAGQAKQQAKPFMLYLSYNGAHFPLQAPENLIRKFKGKFKKGWSETRNEIYKRQLKMNLLGENYALTAPNPLIPDWTKLDKEQMAQSEHIMEIYAATVTSIDENVGRLVKYLKSQNLFDNTVIMILSDNGGSAEGETVFGTYKGTQPGAVNSTVFLGQGWAETTNTPFYLYKQNTHEGGISTPFIVTYPHAIPAEMNGKIVHQPAHVIDIMATLVSVSSAVYPTEYKGSKITPMQGVNLLPLWKGETVKRNEPLFWEHENNLALRDGKWKLVKEVGDESFQLYDMEKDRTETNDLAQNEPEVYKEMLVKFETMFHKTGAAHLKFNQRRWFVSPQKYR
jgi:arylsulfatase